MAEPATDGTPGPGSRRAAARGASQPWLEMLQSLWRDVPGLLSDRVELLTLELQRAGMALAKIVVLVVAAAILGVTAWLLLWAGIVVGLVALGLPTWLVLIGAFLLNLLAILGAVAYLKTLLPLLRLPATRRHLTITPDPTPTAPASPPQGPRTDTHDHDLPHAARAAGSAAAS